MLRVHVHPSIERVALPVTATAEPAAPHARPRRRRRRPTVAKATGTVPRRRARRRRPHARGRAARPARGGSSRLEARATGPLLQPALRRRVRRAPRARARHHARSVCCSRPIRERRSVVARYRRSLVCRALAPTALHSLMARIPPRWRLWWTWPHESGPYEVESANLDRPINHLIGFSLETGRPKMKISPSESKL